MPLRDFQPEHYEALLSAKVDGLRERFAALGAPAPEVFPSPARHYRMRAEFRIKHIDGDPHYVMFPREAPREAVVIDDFPVACQSINTLMPALQQRLAASDILKRRLFQVEFLSGLSEEVLVSLIYHRPLDDAWESAARQLMAELPIHVIGRSRKQKRVLGKDFIDEHLSADNRQFHFRHYENSFTQPNARVNEAMIGWACSQAREAAGDLLELYCGCGNFTIPLARYFPRALATEVAKTSVQAALENCALNGVDNIQVARLSAEEITTALQGLRRFRRLADIDLSAFDLRTILVDPPRAGLDDATRELVAGFDDILYISCNPDTLLRDLDALCQNHHIEALAFFDQFPYTHHMECGVFLRRAAL